MTQEATEQPVSFDYGEVVSQLLTGNRTEECVECGGMMWHQQMILHPAKFGWAHPGCCIGISRD